VPVPAAPEIGDEKFNGAETGQKAKPVRVTTRTEFEGIATDVMNDTIYRTSKAPAEDWFVVTEGAETNKLCIAGNLPKEPTTRTTPDTTMPETMLLRAD
jgi:hypothetical protein